LEQRSGELSYSCTPVIRAVSRGGGSQRILHRCDGRDL